MVRLLTLMERPFSEFTVRFMLGLKVLKLLVMKFTVTPPPSPQTQL